MAESSTPREAPRLSLWQRFWHVPVRAERLALMRICLGLALLSDQFLQVLPAFSYLFGPGGTSPAGLHEAWQLEYWNWTILFFYTDDLTVLALAFAAWVAVALLWTVGLWTRTTNVVLWLLTLAFLWRNPNHLNGGDYVLMVGLFLLMLSPCGRALSLDARRRRHQTGQTRPAYTEAWPVRLIQIQLCTLYCCTGLVKLKGEWDWDGPFHLTGTWWDGTSVHYVANFLHMTRWSYAQLPVPFWVTRPLTYATAWWEALFPLLVLWRWTRRPALAFGLLLHLGIVLQVEVGTFSFFTMAFYAVWVPCTFWRRWDQFFIARSRDRAAPPGPALRG